MLRTKTSKTRQEMFDAYKAKPSKYLINKELEWLIEQGQIRESVYFKGATGDRYTIYIATRRNKNVIDIGTVHNGYDHGTSLGIHIATLRDYVLTMEESGNSWNSIQYGLGYSLKQLMRQGVMSKKHPWKIRFCRSAYFVKLNAHVAKGDHVEFSPWNEMKIDLKSGILVNKPTRHSISEYKKAKEEDRTQRKRNRIANKNNADALARYRKAGGDTAVARDRWGSAPGSQGAVSTNADGKIDWDMIPMDDIFKHRNATLRSNILEHYGINTLLKTLEHDVIDIDFIDEREYKLLNVTIPDLASGQELADK